jgi:hypothetical protein
MSDESKEFHGLVLQLINPEQVSYISVDSQLATL